MNANSLISNLKYKDAEQLMDSDIIIRNHRILDVTVNYIEDSVLILEKPEIEINPMRTDIFYITPAFLMNPKEQYLIDLIKDIEEYKQSYEELSQKVNIFTNEVSDSLKELYEPSNNLKIEICKVVAHFEETIKNLCVPLISEKEGLNTIKINNLSEEQKNEINKDKSSITQKIEEFKKESDRLNRNYNELFNQMSKAVQIICNSIKDIPSTITDFQDKVDKGMTKFEEILEKFQSKDNHEKFHNYLIKVKETFKIISSEKDKIIKITKEKINNLIDQYEKRKIAFNSLKKDSNDSINKLISKSNSIKDDIIKVRNKNKEKPIVLPEIKITEIILNNVFDSMDKSIESLTTTDNSISKSLSDDIDIDEIIRKTSLDLLFIMDITGSMEQYVEETKKKLIEIMERITYNCIGIDIHLGFIGYKDIEENFNGDFVDIDLTEEHNEVKNGINKIRVGGGDDTAEDVAWALEKALEKKWKNKTRFAILVTDAPCHGKKYHDKNLIDNFPQGDPHGRNIEKLVQKLVEKEVSLLCIKLKDDTNIMYGIFKDIYNSCNKKKCQFNIIPMKSHEELVGIVVDNTSKNYKKKKI